MIGIKRMNEIMQHNSYLLLKFIGLFDVASTFHELILGFNAVFVVRPSTATAFTLPPKISLTEAKLGCTTLAVVCGSSPNKAAINHWQERNVGIVFQWDQK
jgi:hypothetical protein